MKDSHSKISSEKDLSSVPMDHGTNLPLLLWIDCKVESTANKREHWTKSQKRNQSQKQAVQKAVQGIKPPKVPDESEDTQ